MRKTAFAALALVVQTAQAMTLDQFARIPSRDQAMYLGGVYDMLLSERPMTDCVERMQFQGLADHMDALMGRLPSDPNSPERRVLGSMNMALVTRLEIEKACSAPVKK